ncbi:MAG TPA: transposase, partial [Candidatus Acidoferrum sp.]|nr:transposase [Candidatus Acidoferrum sp.]
LRQIAGPIQIGRASAGHVVRHLKQLAEEMQTAALAGLAPYNHDSGPQRGQRHIAHGRALARTALYTAALVAARYNPVLRPFYQRLRAAGKPARRPHAQTRRTGQSPSQKLFFPTLQLRRLLPDLSAFIRYGDSQIPSLQ